MVGAIAEDVVFDHAGAEELARSLESTARLLEEQSDVRPGLVHEASVHFRGACADDFSRRSGTAVSDGGELAGALRRAAAGLRRMSEAARAEQQRREAARRWQQQQEDRSTLSRIGDDIHDFFAGEDDAPPPPPAQDAPRFVSSSCVAPTR